MQLSKPVIIGMIATLISIGGGITFHLDRQNKIAEEALQYQRGQERAARIRARIGEASAREDIEKTRALVHDRWEQLPDGTWEKITPESNEKYLAELNKKYREKLNNQKGR
jgi:hypothetical protein